MENAKTSSRKHVIARVLAMLMAVLMIGSSVMTASAATSYYWPLGKTRGVITSKFGKNGRYDYHTGIDIAAKKGTKIYAATGGKVIYAGTMGGYGKTIKIQNNDGKRTIYAHLSKIGVKKGKKVKKAAYIGKVGATGHATAAHLHFEVKKRSKVRTARQNGSLLIH
ncbi:MAG: M23 family metallopeptidase [Lachnospiraceae bacterium]|nr:M23 family metallopeptidase [Lachnospiraceae bacterium]